MALNKYGLRPLPHDKRDFQLGQFTVLPELSELPESFELTTPFPVKYQGDTDYCSAYASCGVSELQENVELAPVYSFAVSKDISGDPSEWGQNLRDACKSHLRGALPQKYFEPTDRPRYLDSYPTDYAIMAEKHRKKSYFSVTGPYDSFDNVRATIWKYREEKRAVLLGVIFSWKLEDYILTNPQPQGFGHAMYITGWDKDGLIVVNSYGEKAGKNGKHRIPRGTANSFIPRFGAFSFLDIDPDTAKTLLSRREWILASLWGKIILFFKGLWQ